MLAEINEWYFSLCLSFSMLYFVVVVVVVVVVVILFCRAVHNSGFV